MELQQKLLDEFITKGWHETSCPAHSFHMHAEKKCNCLYGMVVEMLGGKVEDL